MTQPGEGQTRRRQRASDDPQPEGVADATAEAIKTDAIPSDTVPSDTVPSDTVTPLATADGSRTLYSARYRQTFHSAHGAASEARHVFVVGAGVAARLGRGLATRVLEVGFGTGLNAWLSADAACTHQTPLHHLALERDLLPAARVAALEHAELLEHPEVLARYLAWRARLEGGSSPGARETPAERPNAGRYRLELAPSVTLELWIGEAQTQALPSRWAHAIYHDAFSPDANPELWTEAFLAQLYRALEPGGVLVSYTVKGEVRRSLARLGFEVAKRPGPPGGKREVLVAHKPPGAAAIP